jgi:hypothetical protein
VYSYILPNGSGAFLDIIVDNRFLEKKTDILFTYFYGRPLKKYVKLA